MVLVPQDPRTRRDRASARIEQSGDRRQRHETKAAEGCQSFRCPRTRCREGVHFFLDKRRLVRVCGAVVTANAAPEAEMEKLLREEQESVEWGAVEPEDDRNGNLLDMGLRKLRTRDGGTVLAALSPDQDRYLRALETYPVERIARRKAQVTPRQVKRWRREEWFRSAETEASREAADLLLADAWSAAKDGRLEPVVQMGMLVGYRRVYSERLHVALLQALLPQHFNPSAATPPRPGVTLASPEAIADAVRRLSPTATTWPQAPARPRLPEV